MEEQLQLVAPAQPKAGATHARTGSSSPVGVTLPPRPTDRHVLRGMCGDCGKWPDIDPLTLNMKHHRYRKCDVRGRTGRCVGVGTPPVSYSWVVPIA